jgi:hypothetical protein
MAVCLSWILIALSHLLVLSFSIVNVHLIVHLIVYFIVRVIVGVWGRWFVLKVRCLACRPSRALSAHKQPFSRLIYQYSRNLVLRKINSLNINHKESLEDTIWSDFQVAYVEFYLFSAFSHLWKKCTLVLAMSVCLSVRPWLHVFIDEQMRSLSLPVVSTELYFFCCWCNFP